MLRICQIRNVNIRSREGIKEELMTKLWSQPQQNVATAEQLCYFTECVLSVAITVVN